VKKIIIIVIILIVVGGTGLVVYNIRSTPEEVPQTESAQMSTPASGTTSTTQATRRGAFNEQDQVHKGTGQAILDGSELRLDEAFTVTNGPDLYVYLSKDPSGKNIDDTVSLGKLKSTKGGQTYTLPANSNEFKSVIIYCRAFKQSFSVAPLQ